MKKLLASLSAASLLLGIAGTSIASPAGDKSKNIVVAQTDKMEGKMAGNKMAPKKKAAPKKAVSKKKAGGKIAAKKNLDKMAGAKMESKKPAAK